MVVCSSGTSQRAQSCMSSPAVRALPSNASRLRLRLMWWAWAWLMGKPFVSHTMLCILRHFAWPDPLDAMVNAESKSLLSSSPEQLCFCMMHDYPQGFQWLQAAGMWPERPHESVMVNGREFPGTKRPCTYLWHMTSLLQGLTLAFQSALLVTVLPSITIHLSPSGMSLC